MKVESRKKISVNLFFWAFDNFLGMQKFTFKDIILLLVICAFVWLCECILCVCEHLQRPSGGNRSSESGVTSSGEPHNGVLVMEPNSPGRGYLYEGCVIGRFLNLVDLGIQMLHNSSNCYVYSLWWSVCLVDLWFQIIRTISIWILAGGLGEMILGKPLFLSSFRTGCV